MRIGVTGAGALLGQGIIRAIRFSDLDAHVVAMDPSDDAVGFYWADARRQIPMAADPRFVDEIVDTVRAERVEILLVGTDVELPKLAGARAQIESSSGAAVVVSDERVVAIANDKWLTNRFLAEHALPRPESCLPGDEDTLVDTVGFPLVVKPRVGARSVGLRTVSTREQLRAAIAEGGPDVVIQEYVATMEDEYTAGVLCFAGEPTISIVMRRMLRDGNTSRAIVDRFPELNAQVQHLARMLRPYGPANFQFRVESGLVKVFEINARFSGTTPLRARAGFNEVALTVRHVLNGDRVAVPSVQRMKFLRYLDEIATPLTDGR